MIVTLTPGAIAEAAAARLSSEQLFALAARVAAAEMRPPEPRSDPDLATSIKAFGLLRAAARALDRYDEVGVDRDLAAVALLGRLRHAGVGHDRALAALLLVTGWRPRTDAERREAVRRLMVEDGFPADLIDTATTEAFGT